MYPREIEETLDRHDAVAQVAVIGVPDERWGEQIAAVVRATDPSAPPSPAALHEFCRIHLAPFKTPKLWFFVEDFPMTPSGKIQKFVLQQQQVAAGDLHPGPG